MNSLQTREILPQIINLSISPSKLRDYLYCPLMFQLKHLQKLNTYFPTPALAIGNSIHAVLEEIYDPKRSNQPFDIEECLQKHWQVDSFQSRAESEKYFASSVKNLSRFLEAENNPAGNVIGTELFLSSKVQMPFDSFIRFSCKVDRLDALSDSLLHIVDYKTNANGTLPTMDSLLTDLPTFIYYLVVRMKYRQYKHALISFVNICSLMKMTLDYDKEQREANKQALIRTVSQIQSGKFEAKSGVHCQWCSVNENCPSYSCQSDLVDLLL